MKRTRALHHLRTVAEVCADMATRPASIFPLRVRQAWAAGGVLDGADDLDVVTVAFVVDLPAEDVAWLTAPNGAQHWVNAARLQTAPVAIRWRSLHAPVWNHALWRPALVWDLDSGIAHDTLDAIEDGAADSVRLAAPDADKEAARHADDLAISLAALRATTAEYTERRWAPGKLEPVADRLWHASEGYLDLLATRH